jgi:hypothetical protein
MDNPTPEDAGTIIGWIIGIVVAAVTAVRKLGFKFFNPQIAESLKSIDEKLDKNQATLTELSKNFAVHDERFDSFDKRLTRLEDK